MNAEYFAPREDVILQNEAPSDFYILVTGSVVKTTTTRQTKSHTFFFPLTISSRLATVEFDNQNKK